ncbi:I78 family peptidase inhibitor [Qipengyuania sp. CAU 1752]
MKALLPLLASAMLAACATAPVPAEPAEPTQRMPGEDSPCDAAQAQSYIGQKASQATGQAILEKTGSHIFQWVAPDSAVTMDYRPDRVRVSYDREMTITTVRCG